MGFKVVVDTDVCTGHGRCYDLSPTVFDADDFGHSALVHPVVDGDLLVAARRAVASCPERAISVIEE